MNLETEIANWDQKSVSAIKSIYRSYADSDDFEQNLVDALDVPSLQRGASWMLKHRLEEDTGELTPLQVLKLFEAIPGLQHWEAQLHILQILPVLTIPGEMVATVQSFLGSCVHSSNKFVRAWAYSGYQALGLQHSEFRRGAVEILQRAQSTETAASAQVRIRRGLQALARS